MLSARREPFGERLHLWCPAGTDPEALTSACELLAFSKEAARGGARWRRHSHAVGGPLPEPVLVGPPALLWPAGWA
jgi:hypothetical protein